MPNYRCIVATPNGQLFSGDIAYARIPGHDGYYGVLSGHEQFVGLNRSGILTLNLDENGNEQKKFLIYKGITQVFNNHLSVLAQLGREVDEIDIADTKEKLAAAKADLEEIKREYDEADDAQIKTREDYIEWCELQLAVKEQGVLV